MSIFDKMREKAQMREDELERAKEDKNAEKQKAKDEKQALRERQAAIKQAQKDTDRQKRADERFMRAAIEQGRRAAAIREVPIGCVIVRNGRIIASGYNRRNNDKSVLSHAELIAIKEACRKTGDWRLEDCTLYVTLEPCPMCAGAIVQARIPRVVIGTQNAKAGCAGSVMNLLKQPGFNHQCDITYDVLHDDCAAMITGFFRQLREEKRLAEEDVGKPPIKMD
ncbi:MAG: tRNA adenosine(34) deaminase TadA [Lachnospiraceae bacterium]|jgi:tRNA(adenine34) deaminase|nr:tRNA adenosine(34) deaminase TadA [Lachnospiraceae bacterium]MDY3990990.1 tRNA adenosine(34) deaminase TadA [Lachnospiraceae bacterium]